MKSLTDQAERLRIELEAGPLNAEIWEQQRQAGVDALSTQGQQIEATMRQIDAMERLKAASEQWRDTIKSAFVPAAREKGLHHHPAARPITLAASPMARPVRR